MISEQDAERDASMLQSDDPRAVIKRHALNTEGGPRLWESEDTGFVIPDFTDSSTLDDYKSYLWRKGILLEMYC